jgi:hypothetical protein
MVQLLEITEFYANQKNTKVKFVPAEKIDAGCGNQAQRS